MTADEFCTDTASVWGVLGYFVLLLKIIVPLVLIVLGMIDLSKAVIASDDKGVSKAVNMLLHRFIAAVVIFFIPTIVSAIFNTFTNMNLENDGVKKCVNCLLNVTGQEEGYCKTPDD